MTWMGRQNMEKCACLLVMCFLDEVYLLFYWCIQSGEGVEHLPMRGNSGGAGMGGGGIVHRFSCFRLTTNEAYS